MKKKRILHLISSTLIGGAPEIVKNIVKYGDKNQFDIYVVTTNDGPYFDILKQVGANVISLNMQGHKFNLLIIRKVAKILKKYKFDIIHIHGARAGFFATFANMLLGIPSIYTGHGHAFEGRTTFLVRTFYLWLERLITKQVNLFAAVSKSDKRIALKYNVVKRCKIVIIQNGVDFERVFTNTIAEDIRLTLGVLEHEYLIGTLGRITSQKGPFVFLDIIEKLVTEHKNIKVVWIGDGELRKELEHEIRKRGLEYHLEILGFRDDAVQLLSQLDAFIMSSLYEPFGLVAIEAMLGKVPVIASQVGALPDLIQQGITGYIFSLDNIESASNYIFQALQEKSRDKMIEDAFRHALKNYDAKEMVQQYELLYHSLIR